MIPMIGGLFLIINELYYLNRIDARWERARQRFLLQGIEVERTEAWDQSQKKEGILAMVGNAFLLTYGMLVTFGPSQIVSILRLEFLTNPIFGMGIGLLIALLGISLVIFSEKAWELNKKWSKLEFVTEGVPKNWFSDSVLFGGLALLFGLSILFFSIASKEKTAIL